MSSRTKQPQVYAWSEVDEQWVRWKAGRPPYEGIQLAVRDPLTGEFQLYNPVTRSVIAKTSSPRKVTIKREYPNNVVRYYGHRRAVPLSEQFQKTARHHQQVSRYLPHQTRAVI